MGGRGRGRGGFGRGRGSFAALPMGLTHADLQNLSREASAMYPPMIPPVLTDYTEDEKKIAAYQIGFAQRLRKSAYYVVEPTKSNELPKYSDKYRTSVNSRPTLKKKDLHAPYFPPDIFDGYFNPKKKRKTTQPKAVKKSMDIDEFAEDDEEKEKPSDASDAGSQAPDSDYDVDEEYDNDYAENYFDNGEADDNDDLGGGGGGDEGGGGDYD